MALWKVKQDCTLAPWDVGKRSETRDIQASLTTDTDFEEMPKLPKEVH